MAAGAGGRNWINRDNHSAKQAATAIRRQTFPLWASASRIGFGLSLDIRPGVVRRCVSRQQRYADRCTWCFSVEHRGTGREYRGIGDGRKRHTSHSVEVQGGVAGDRAVVRMGRFYSRHSRVTLSIGRLTGRESAPLLAFVAQYTPDQGVSTFEKTIYTNGRATCYHRSGDLPHRSGRFTARNFDLQGGTWGRHAGTDS